MFIDRSTEIRELYWGAVRESHSINIGVVSEFSKAAETDPEEALAFVLEQLTFEDPQTTLVLEGLNGVLVDCARGYSKSVANWETHCRKVWKHGNQDVKEVTKRERAAVAAVTAEQSLVIEPLRKEIRALQRRMGLSE